MTHEGNGNNYHKTNQQKVENRKKFMNDRMSPVPCWVDICQEPPFGMTFVTILEPQQVCTFWGRDVRIRNVR